MSRCSIQGPIMDNSHVQPGPSETSIPGPRCLSRAYKDFTPKKIMNQIESACLQARAQKNCLFLGGLAEAT